MPPWHSWLHCTGTLYGQWLPGDPRGWRERDHRHHIDADYKHQLPPGAFDWLHDKSKELMTRDPVSLTFDQRTAVCREFFNALNERHIPTAEISIGAIHWHALCQFASSDRDPKLIIGEAKGKCAFVLSKQAIVKPGGIWAKGCRTLPINDEKHFRNAKKYIHDHILESAAVLSEITQPPPITP